MRNHHEIIIDQNRCIGCGSCVTDCLTGHLQLKDAKATVTENPCIVCGHCYAVCPENAVTIAGFPEDEIIPVQDGEHIDSDLLLDVIKCRRSIRQFKDTPIEQNKLLKIIEAGRYAPTAVNRQNVSYLAITKRRQKVERLAVAFFRKLQEEEPEALKMWHFDDHFFFKGAPCAVVVLADNDVDGALAAANMERMANALGIGVLYSGFFTIAANHLPDVRQLLGLQENETAVTTLVLGYPAMKYFRSAPREKAQFREV